VSDDYEEDEAIGDGAADTEAEVTCPYCGEIVTIALDPAGGVGQEYVEDCQVCCRPWTVHVTFDATGGADVQLDTAE